MQTFCISTLGCKVNQYESEQIATLLRSHGLRQVSEPQEADLRIVNTCSVTVQAASKSRQTVRRTVSLPILNLGQHGHLSTAAHATQFDLPSKSPRTVVTGCWATSDSQAASELPGVAAVITHHDDVAERLRELLGLWESEKLHPPKPNTSRTIAGHERSPEPVGDKGWMIQAGTPA